MHLSLVQRSDGAKLTRVKFAYLHLFTLSMNPKGSLIRCHRISRTNGFSVHLVVEKTT